MVVAIDGPRGGGQEHGRARCRARALGFPYLDSGAMYRLWALWRIDHGGGPPSTPRALDIQLGARVIANGEA